MTAARVLDWTAFHAVAADLRRAAGPERADLCAELEVLRRQSSHPPEDSSPGESGPLLVLVVDDEPAVLTGARRILECDGHVVLMATDADRAIGLLGHDPQPDVVVCDMHLGEGRPDGLTVARAARQRCPRARVIIWSGWPDLDVEAARAQVGADAAVRKSDARALSRAVAAARVEVSRVR